MQARRRGGGVMGEMHGMLLGVLLLGDYITWRLYIFIVLLFFIINIQYTHREIDPAIWLIKTKAELKLPFSDLFSTTNGIGAKSNGKK